MEHLIKLLRDSYDLQEQESEKSAYWHLQQLRSEIKQLTLTDVGCSLPNKIEINFDGNLLAEIETTDKNLKVLRAVNGYGEAVNVAKIQVVKK